MRASVCVCVRGGQLLIERRDVETIVAHSVANAGNPFSSRQSGELIREGQPTFVAAERKTK